MATKDLYGIGKGSAQVVDLRPVNAMVQDRQDAARRRNEAKAKKRATMASAINSQMDKLKNTAWSRDQQYVSDLMSDTRSWMADTYSKYGEMSLVDNPELKREFNERVGFIKRQNDASHANIQMGNKMLEELSGNLDDIDEESGIAFNKWLDLPPAERLSTPMPIIRDREMTLDEVVNRDVKSEIEGLQVPKGYTGVKDEETGRITTYKGRATDEAEYDQMIKDYNLNPNSTTFKYADREARKLINEDRYPPYITDEAGEQVQNPKYIEQLNSQRESLIKQSFDKYKKKDYTTTTSTYKPIKEEKETPSGFRTSTGLSSSYFREQGMEGFTLANPKTGSAVKPILSSVEMADGDFQTVKVNPSHFIKTPKGNIIKGQVAQSTWDELSDSEKSEWEKENPGQKAEDYNLSHSRGDVVEIVVTPSVESQMKDQYGITGFESHLKEVKEGIKDNEEQDESKEEKKKPSSKNITESEYNSLKSGDTYMYNGEEYTKK